MTNSKNRFPLKPTPLRPHQKEAVKAILNEFVEKKEPRTKYIAPCGSGKTLVGLHVAEALNPKSVIIFLPSLALIRQTLIEWSRESMFRGLYTPLFVCSDKTLTEGTDENMITEKDLGHPITTESSTVNRFLHMPMQVVKIIFSTYQSARVVAAGLPKNFRFDFGILDEAHRTAGPKGKPFGLVLEDEKIAILRRLSMTATPRHFKIKRAALDGEVLAYSMDSKKLYGSTAHILNFQEAVKRDLVCDHQTLVSTISDSDVDDNIFNKKLVINNVAWDAERIANVLAIRNAVDRMKIKKIFTFHGRIEDAKEFIHAKNPPIELYLPGFKAFHVNGSMPTEKREAIMDEFRRAPAAILSNVRCLSEGIDVPAVDCVAFMCPKHSTVDIIQAVGRASRKHQKKKTGFVLLPVFLNEVKKEEDEAAIDRANYTFIWRVINSLKEQDEALDLIIKNEMTQFGMEKTGYVPDFKEKVKILGSSKTLEALSRGIKVKILEKTGESFDYWVGLLKAYKIKYKHCNVPVKCKFRGKNLGDWLAEQRKYKRRGMLDSKREAILNQVGINWSPLEDPFPSWFDLLMEYKKEFGDCNVTQKLIYRGKKLGNWVSDQRISKRAGKLEPKKVAMLNRIEFDWEPKTGQFYSWLALLKEYRNKFGTCNISQNVIYKKRKLGQWLRNQRVLKWNGRMALDRMTSLNTVGPEWDPLGDPFSLWIVLLKKYKDKFGDCRVPMKCVYEGKMLGFWIQHQMKLNESGKLKPQEIAQFNKLGLDLNTSWTAQQIRISNRGGTGPTRSESFTNGITLLKQYKDEFGDCMVPQKFLYNGYMLGRWVAHQRNLRRRGKLDPKKEVILDQIGFQWNPVADGFPSWLALLKEYRKEFGTFFVKASFIYKGKQLGLWLARQRHLNKNGALDPKRRALLKKCGVIISTIRFNQKNLKGSSYGK